MLSSVMNTGVQQDATGARTEILKENEHTLAM